MRGSWALCAPSFQLPKSDFRNVVSDLTGLFFPQADIGAIIACVSTIHARLSTGMAGMEQIAGLALQQTLSPQMQQSLNILQAPLA